MARDLTRLLTRAPQLVYVDGRAARSLFLLECGHPRDALRGFWQTCAPCGAIPHPRTNPKALTEARRRKA